MSRDIYEFIEQRNVDALVGEVRDDSECCNWMVENQPVEFGNDVGATLVLRYDNDGTEIPRMHFAVERFFDSGISDEDEVAELEVVLDNGGSMLLFETDHGFDSGGDEPPHQICSYTLLFLLFLHFPYIADPPLCTSAPT